MTVAIENLVIGGGVSGIAAARALAELKLEVAIVDTSPALGGMWSRPYGEGPLYKNTHIISSRRVQAFDDFPMPDDWPDYPHHSLIRKYLDDFVDKYGLRRAFHAGERVLNISRQSDGAWRVETSRQTWTAANLILATGVANKANLPSWPGNFSGQLIHSYQYEGPHQLIGKRVLVVGGRQSAIDVVNEAAVCANLVVHSIRNGMIVLPKYVMDQPLEEFLDTGDRIERRNQAVREAVAKTVRCRVPLGELGQVPPCVDDLVPYYYSRGVVRSKPDIAEFEGKAVRFTDGTREEVDLIVAATGYRIDLPFLREVVTWNVDAERPPLVMRTLSKTYSNLYAVGFVEPFGAHWRIYDLQAKLVGLCIQRRRNQLPVPLGLLNEIEQVANAGVAEPIARRYPLRVDKLVFIGAMRDAIERVRRGDTG